ncbi:MAG TPA: hypothetical protein VK558_04410 [Patescibacteria group bacterium]|nr:hypothetical protein [Patescibacteria group bacterium]
MRQIVGPLVVAGLAQWMALGWWSVVDGVSVNISLAIMFHQLFGLDPRVAWDPAQRLLSAFLELSPGTVFLAIAGYLWARSKLARLVVESRRQRHVERQRPA